ncbi:hypothetical protein P4V41_20610 [Fictibacillus nanhaiensis]|uniref:hypothetical protein n=1 Tax=Fictibacillus nanhaiensis TaxID=742169 RepID=UPI002E1C5D6C|nr:hypothetical protein [Fictibacillus nanhaiensis]
MIIDIRTGQTVNERFKALNREDLITYDIKKAKDSWQFDWKRPFSRDSIVFGLFAEGENRVQGLLALYPNNDPDFLCVDLDWVESAPHNKRIALDRKYVGVGKTLVSFACWYSLEHFDGHVMLSSKSSKVPLYLGMGALHGGFQSEEEGGHPMIFYPQSSKKNVERYLLGGVTWIR